MNAKCLTGIKYSNADISICQTCLTNCITENNGFLCNIRGFRGWRELSPNQFVKRKAFYVSGKDCSENLRFKEDKN